MVKYMVMKKVNVHEAKANLSRYLEEAEKGEVVVVCRRNVPVAEIRALPARPPRPRPIGLGKGRVQVTEDFFEPLPEKVIESFSGGRE